MISSRQFFAGSGLLFAFLLWSAWAPFDRTTWLLEVFPVLLAWPLLWHSRQSYPLTPLLYSLILLHAAVLILGGTYSYARVPLGFWLMDWFALDRNPYDKIGHLMQGFVPVLVAREILIRGAYVQGQRMLQFLLLCIVLAISASYELIEWGAAVALGQGADEFLGTQGYAWETQADMAFALLGAVLALLLFSRWHDQQICQLASTDV